MTGKLMKYELRGCMRIFLPLWAAVLVLSVINGLTIGNQADASNFWVRMFLYALPAIILFVLLVAMFVISFVIIVRRFYNGLLGEGGYFAFSLPATTAQQIFARLLTACIMQLGCLVTAALSGVIIFSIQAGNPVFGELKQFLAAAGNFLKNYPRITLLAVEAVILFILILAEGILRLYSAIAVGHLASSHRGWLSVAAYLVMGFVITYLFGRAGLIFGKLFADSVTLETAIESINYAAKVFGIVIAGFAIEDLLLWLITHVIISKKLNIL